MPPPTINSPRGQLTSEQVADPAAGAVFSITVPDRRIYLVHSLHFVLTTAAGGAARNAVLTITDGANDFFFSESPVSLQASKVGHFTASHFGFVPSTPVLVIPLFMPEIPLCPGCTVSLDIENLAGGDQITDTIFYYEQFAAGTP